MCLCLTQFGMGGFEVFRHKASHTTLWPITVGLLHWRTKHDALSFSHFQGDRTVACDSCACLPTKRFFVSDVSVAQVCQYTAGVAAEGATDTAASGDGSPSDVIVTDSCVSVLGGMVCGLLEHTWGLGTHLLQEFGVSLGFGPEGLSVVRSLAAPVPSAPADVWTPSDSVPWCSVSFCCLE